MIDFEICKLNLNINESTNRSANLGLVSKALNSRKYHSVDWNPQFTIILNIFEFVFHCVI